MPKGVGYGSKLMMDKKKAPKPKGKGTKKMGK